MTWWRGATGRGAGSFQKLDKAEMMPWRLQRSTAVRMLGLQGQDTPTSQREEEAPVLWPGRGTSRSTASWGHTSQGQRSPWSHLGPGSELGCRAPAWASNSRWGSFCAVTSTPCEPISLGRSRSRREGGFPEHRAGGELRGRAEGERLSGAPASRRAAQPGGKGALLWSEPRSGLGSSLALALLRGQSAQRHWGVMRRGMRAAAAPAWVLGRGTHSGQGFLDVLSGSRNVPEDHACAVLLQTVQKEPVFSFIKNFYN